MRVFSRVPTEQLQNWLHTMVRLQREHNEKVHPAWDGQGYRFTRAIWIECAELIEHFGWKWWKYQEPDLEQVELELVDIWHFGLSTLIVEYGDQVVDVIAGTAGTSKDADALLDFREAVEDIAQQALMGRFSLTAFAQAMRLLPMSFERLYTIYVAKNVLNVFRQAHGYKEGSYRKLWQGREDNEHLTELAQTLDVATESFKSDLQRLLEIRYTEVLAD